MKWDAFQAKVAELRESQPVWFALEADPAADSSQVKQAEEALKATLPEGYRLFVNTFGGGYFAFGNVFSVQSNSDWNIVARNRDAAIPDFICVTDTGTGDYYGFKVEGTVCSDQVYFWDHEIKGGAPQAAYADFFEFLEAYALQPG